MTGNTIWVWVGAAVLAVAIAVGLSVRDDDAAPTPRAGAPAPEAPEVPDAVAGGATDPVATREAGAETTATVAPDAVAVAGGATDPVATPEAGAVAEAKPEGTVEADPASAERAGTAPEPDVAAALQPDDTASETAVEAPEAPGAATAQDADGDGPRFDLVRVDADGAAVVAGKATPGAEVAIVVGGTTLETLRADETGSFVSLLTVPELDAAKPMRLQETSDGGPKLSGQTVLIVPPTRPGAVQPTVVVTEAGTTTLLQPAEPVAPQAPVAPDAVARDAAPARLPLALDTISYDGSTGSVVLAGRGEGQQFVRVYMDNVALETQAVPRDGSWQVVLPDVAEGTYTLRVDQISPSGTVLSRVESPFRREAPAAVTAAAQASADGVSVTVQPGNTLWALAEARYGDGVRYVRIFEANRDAIRNPDLIYPGQIFDLPAGE